jgi:GH15 family glucan-1,4-alpha-glucosidase
MLTVDQNLVYRYDVNKSDDGVGGEEGTFCLCTLWCVEALTRAGEYERPLLQRAVAMFEVCPIFSNLPGSVILKFRDEGFPVVLESRGPVQ